MQLTNDVSGTPLCAYAVNTISYGNDKKNGGHDHRTNRGSDRTPSQQEGDKKTKTEKQKS